MELNSVQYYCQRSRMLIERAKKLLTEDSDQDAERVKPNRNLTKLIQEVADGANPEGQLLAIQEIRTELSLEDAPIQEMIQKGLLPVLVECLKGNNAEKLQFEATWALTNITSGSSDHTTQVVAAGAVPHFVELLKSKNMDTCEQAIWALGNIIGDGPLLRDFVIKLGVVQPLLHLVQPNMISSVVCNVALVIGNLCRHYDPPVAKETVLELLPTLEILMDHSDTEILRCTLWAISFLVGGGEDYIQVMIFSRLIPKIISYMGDKEAIFRYPAINAVENILTEIEEPNEMTGDEEIRRIAIRNQAWMVVLIRGGLVSIVREFLKSGDPREQALAVRAMSNITIHCNQDQILILIKRNIIEPLCDLLTYTFEDISKEALKVLNNMLKKSRSHLQKVAQTIFECGGLAKIEALQVHFDEEVYLLALHIIETYYTDEI
ncbi:importin subunit alpha-3-like [Drosophila eugracilis]|uniref:importin subunit alpha-3-like n=1 Tax=Drosophila eugracilis TaxID=29029 RepID=UPI0007E5DAD4|nr:importin subunit alpha-3-like [Drosophila eugracilis]